MGTLYGTCSQFAKQNIYNSIYMQTHAQMYKAYMRNIPVICYKVLASVARIH